jgi:NAD(P)H-hydrate epimerase
MRAASGASLPRVAYSAAQIRAAERPLLEAGVPLMQRAAAGLAQELRVLLEERGSGPGARVLVLAGAGDNGGDALFAAAELAREETLVDVLATGSRIHDAAVRAALAAGAHEVPAEQAAELAAEADLVLDGILGIGAGADPALRGRAREIVTAILPRLDTAQRPLVIAVDLPSGVGPDDGAVPEQAVLRADVTVTFGALTPGLFLRPGADYAGEVRLIDIGLGPALDGVEPKLRRE